MALHSKVYLKAKRNYPKYWSKQQLRDLVEAGQLWANEYEEITGEPYVVPNDGGKGGES